MGDDELFTALQDAVRGVFAQRGEWCGDAVVIVEVVDAAGRPSMLAVSGDLPRWSILGRLEWTRLQVAASVTDES